MSVTWKHIAQFDPVFVQWIVQTYGPLPDGPVVQADYDKYVGAFAGRVVVPTEGEK